MLEVVENLKAIPVPINGGVDETSASDALKSEDAVVFLNWRLSKDGSRIEKRGGLSVEESGLTERILGYSTYINSSAQFCQIAVLETQVMRKVASGAWANILTFSGTNDHTVKPLEIQGKQFIITERGSKVILPDGNVRQIGISKPTIVPSASAAYVGASTPPLLEYMNYANQSAMNAVWTDEDSGGVNASTLVSGSDPDGVAGPDGDQKYMRLNAPDRGHAKRTRDLSSATPISNIYSAEFVTYFDALSTSGHYQGFRVYIDNGSFYLYISIGKDGAWLIPRNNVPLRITTDPVPLNKHIKWVVGVDATDMKKTKVRLFMTYDGLIKTDVSAEIYPQATTGAPLLTFDAYSLTSANDIYIDNAKIYNYTTDSANITGLYRYAVSFLRTGNNGCESNAIKSSIGPVTFTGGGLNDMTVDAESEYTGNVSKVIRLEVKTAGSPQDTVRWSDDGGQTWKGTVKLSPKVYLGYGITVNFGAITGHGATNYWSIPCNCCSVVATIQEITVSGIQESLDEQVTARKLYRTTSNGSKFYYLTTIYDRNVTTEFIDNFADSQLGDELEDDRDLFTEASSTIGKFSEWWDNRLWIADHATNIVYYSAIRDGGGIPEEFDILERFIPIGHGNDGNYITAMKAYKDALYVFKRNEIYVIQKTGYGYAPFHLVSDVGCIADNCVEEAVDYLCFPSEKGFEVFNGVKTYSPDFSVAIDPTYRTADPNYYKRFSIAHNTEFNEVWLSIPNRTSGSAITVVWNYIRNKFYYFQFYKTPTCLVSCKDSTGKRVLKAGMSDGYLCLCESGTSDAGTAISARYRKGWHDARIYSVMRLLEVDYELLGGRSLTVNVYANMALNPVTTRSLSGSSPSAGSIELRRIIGEEVELGINAKWFAVEFINNEDCGGSCKVNEVRALVKPDALKKKIYGD